MKQTSLSRKGAGEGEENHFFPQDLGRGLIDCSFLEIWQTVSTQA
jgi:hypothetical protein